MRALKYIDRHRHRVDRLVANTFVGGAGATLYSAKRFADILTVGDILGSDITNYQIDEDNNISCYINPAKTYEISANVTTTNEITYYVDLDGLCTSVAQGNFDNAVVEPFYALHLPGLVAAYAGGGFFTFKSIFAPIKYASFPAYTSAQHTNLQFNSTSLEVLDFPLRPSLEIQSSSRSGWYAMASMRRLNIPLVTIISNYTSVLTNLNPACIVYCNTALLDWDGLLNEHPRIIYLRDTLGCDVRYVPNQIAPNAPNLSLIKERETSIEITFNQPTSTNAIDFYEIWVDDRLHVYNHLSPNRESVNTIVDIDGLKPNTVHKIEVRAVDYYYNRSVPSNVLTATTKTPKSPPLFNGLGFSRFFGMFKIQDSTIDYLLKIHDSVGVRDLYVFVDSNNEISGNSPLSVTTTPTSEKLSDLAINGVDVAVISLFCSITGLEVPTPDVNAAYLIQDGKLLSKNGNVHIYFPDAIKGFVTSAIPEFDGSFSTSAEGERTASGFGFVINTDQDFYKSYRHTIGSFSTVVNRWSGSTYNTFAYFQPTPTNPDGSYIANQYHVTIGTYALDDTLSTYYDGTLMDSIASLGVTNNYDFVIGRGYTSGGHIGNLRWCGVHNIAITPTQTKELQTQRDEYYALTDFDFRTDLVAAYNFESSLIEYLGVHYPTAWSGVTYSAGVVINGISLNGSGSYLSLEDHDDFSFSDALGNPVAGAISLWVKWDTINVDSEGEWLLSKGINTDPTREYQLVYYLGGLRWTMYDGVGGNIQCNDLSFTPTIGELYNFLITFDDSKLASGIDLYINSRNSGSPGLNASYNGMNKLGGDVIIGTSPWNLTFRELDGMVDQIKFYKGRKFTPAESKELYLKELAEFPLL